jgi:hypothetical protein
MMPGDADGTTCISIRRDMSMKQASVGDQAISLDSQNSKIGIVRLDILQATLVLSKCYHIQINLL